MIDQKRLKLAAQITETQIKREELENKGILIALIVIGLSGFYKLGFEYLQFLVCAVTLSFVISILAFLVNFSIKEYLKMVFYLGICIFAISGLIAWLV